MDSEERDPKLDRRLDEWLDDALAGYSQAEPRPGLEQRITATLRAEDRAPVHRRSWWMLLAPVAAALAIFVVTISLFQHRGAEAPKSVARQDTTSTQIQETYVTPAETPETSEKREARVRTAAQPAKQKPALPTRPSPQESAKLSAPPATQAAPASNAIVADSKPVAPSGGAILGGLASRSDVPQARSVMAIPQTALKKSEVEPRGAAGYAAAKAAPVAPPPQALRSVAPRQAMETVDVTAAAPAINSAGEAKSVAPTAANAFDVAAANADRSTTRGYRTTDEPLKRRNQFPVPRPLTPEERLMLSAKDGAAIRPQVTQLPPGDEPLPAIQIHEVTIKPLKDSEK